jgi:hypothetical protein
MTSLEYYIEQIEQFISMLTDDIKSGEGTVATQTKLAVYREVLEHLEEIEHEPSEDAISRQAVIDRIRESIETYHNQYTTDMLNMWGLFTQFIKEMPPVTPQPKTGHWIKKDGYSDCSECGSHIVTEWDYCPKCGAKMIDPQESEGK